VSPTPTLTPTDWSAPNAYPPDNWEPYAPGSPANPSSVWNTTLLASAARPDPNSATYQAFYANPTTGYPFFNQLGFGLTNEANQYGHPIYFGTSTDPVYTVTCTASWAQAVCPTHSQTFHIPRYAVPAGGSDAHLSDIDYTTIPATEVDTWGTSSLSGTGGTLEAASAGAGPLTGPGLGFGTTAAGYPLWAGIIRAQELISGNISHALFMVIPCTSTATPVYPSIYRTTDSKCPSNKGVPYGARFTINLTPAQISLLPIPTYHKTILTALSLYGAYHGDTNGGGSFSFQVEADEMYTAPGYTSSDCPTNGAPCTPLTAWENTLSNPDWTGSSYNIDLSGDIDWATEGQWLLPPTQ
jgi:hypothetical protein